LIELIAKSGKPLILSTGACNVKDIDWAVRYFKHCGGKKLSLLQCTAKYPSPMNALNLRAIQALKARYHCAIGFSDHSRDPLTAPVAAVALGAEIIEKHYTMDNHLPGPDHAFAITADELKQMVKAIRAVELALGDGIKKIQPEEIELKLYAQRALQAIRDIAKGEPFEEGVNFSILRPGQQRQGVHPRFIRSVEGRKSRREIKAGDGIQKNDFIA
jgi:N-acetylneuraminate synthase